MFSSDTQAAAQALDDIRLDPSGLPPDSGVSAASIAPNESGVSAASLLAAMAFVRFCTGQESYDLRFKFEQFSCTSIYDNKFNTIDNIYFIYCYQFNV